MEPALLITTPGFVHIFEEIINQMDSTSIFKSSLVCKSWWQVIQDHPKRWRCVIRRIQIKENLSHPDFRQGLLYTQMDGKLDFANANWGRILNSNNATQTHSIFVKLLENTFLGMPKVRAWPILTLAMPQVKTQQIAQFNFQ